MGLEVIAVIGKLSVFGIVAFAFSLFGTKIAIRLLPRFGLLDHPGGRHIHQQPVPRGGGIAIVFSFFIAFGAYALWLQNVPALFWRLLFPGTVLAILGLIDDRLDLPAYLKLLVQITCATAVYCLDPRPMTIAGMTLPWYLAYAVTVVWIVAIINAFNLIDGLDGVASGISAVSAVCLACWFLISGNHQSEAAAMIILLGCCLGFLRYNFHPAQIFLGDIGSTFLGFSFAVTGLSGADRAATLTSLLIPLLALGVPIFDEALAVWRRIVRKLLNPSATGVMTGDQDHLHHRLFRESGHQSRAALFLYYLAAFFAMLSILLTFFQNTAPGIAFFLVAVGMLVVIRMLAVPELFASALVIGKGFSVPRKSVLFNVFHPLFDMGVIVMSLFVCRRLLHVSIANIVIVQMLAPLILLLLFSGIYRVYWLRAGMGDYVRLGKLICGGALLSGIVFFIWKHSMHIGGSGMRFVVLLLLFILIIYVIICGERFFIRYAEGIWLYKMQQSRLLQQTDVRRAVIYGGGLYCRLFIEYHFRLAAKRQNYDFLGIIDDDPALQKLRVNGLRVIGTSDELESLYAQKPFDCIIVASSNISEKKQQKVDDFARAHRIDVVRFSVREDFVPSGDRSETTGEKA